MRKYNGSPLLVVIFFIVYAHGILVVGPKFIRVDQNYTLVVSNFNTNRKVNLKVHIEGQTNNGMSALNVTKAVEIQQHMNKMSCFNMPRYLSAGSYKLTIDGQRGFSFHKEVDLVYLRKSISGLIQIDKPVFNPGDTVRFRVIVLDTELKPPTRVKSIYVAVFDSDGNVIRKWTSAQLSFGVFESDLPIAPSPMLGIWNIVVLAEGEELVSKTFEVKEYVLSTFDLQVTTTVIPLLKHQGLNLTIAANYHFGKPVQGLAKLELYLKGDILVQTKQLEVHGKGQVTIDTGSTKRIMKFDCKWHSLNKAPVSVEQDLTVVKQEYITLYAHPFRVNLIKKFAHFHPGLPFKCTLQFLYHDGKVAAGITGKVEVHQTGYEETRTSDSNGLIELELYSTNVTDADYMEIVFWNDSDYFNYYDFVEVKKTTNPFIALELHSPIKLNHQIALIVTCHGYIQSFVYYVLAKGNIIDAGFIQLSYRRQQKHKLQLNVTDQMIPKAKIMVVTMVGRTLMYDFVEIDLHMFLNRFYIRIDEQEIKPGRQIALKLSGRPGVYVGLAAYDEGLLEHNKNNDLKWENIEQMFDGFYSFEKNEFDLFQTMGLFARMLEGFEIDTVQQKNQHSGREIDKVRSRHKHRKHFMESWLWKNVSLGSSGKRTLIETVPDASTTWYLTGFSIDPVYGIGIIKEPIEFKTIQLFYIMDNLPYSIRRGEAIYLQFTIFNNRATEYTVDITLNNVDSQIEFIGRPSQDLSYTKSVSVPPNVGVPITFEVKSRKLGEMVVNVKASIGYGLDTDALVKVIRVLPESLTQSKTESHIIDTDLYPFQTLLINLDINKKADKGSEKFEIRIYPILVPNIEDKIKKLLPQLYGLGLPEYALTSLNIAMLDYLNIFESRKLDCIGNIIDLIHQSHSNVSFYQRADGSFGGKSSRLYNSAFVASALNIASRYTMGNNIILEQKTYDWLASKQDSSGRFDEIVSFSPDTEEWLRSAVGLTSYVVATMQDNAWAKAKHAVVIKKAIAYLSNQILSITNAYDLSIATFALMLNGHRMKDVALQNLMQMSTVTDNGAKRYWKSSNSLQTTAYALLSLVAARKYTESLPGMNWLENQNFHAGSISSIMNTFVQLKALTEITKTLSPSQNNYDVYIINEKLKHTIQINSHDRSMIRFNGIASNTSTIQVNVVGRGFGLLQVIYEYNLNLRNFDPQFKLDVERQKTISNAELRLRLCLQFIDHDSIMHSNRTFVEVTFPSGYVVDQNPISKQTLVNPIQEFEIRYGGTSVFVYYKNLNVERNCFTVTAYRRFKMALRRPAYVVAYDFYDRNINAIKSYEVDEQHVCDICEKNDCPQDCEIGVESSTKQ